MESKFKFTAAFVILSLLLTACSISITTKVNGDGSGVLGFAYKFTKDDLSQLGTYGMNADTICTDLQSQGGSDIPADFTFKQEAHGDETWCVGAKTFDSLDALKAELSGQGFTINTLEISGGKFVFDAVADMSSSDTSSIPFSINITYELTMPGSIDKGKSDADSYNGKTATWNLPLGSSKNMHLESTILQTNAPLTIATLTNSSSKTPTRIYPTVTKPPSTPTATIVVEAASNTLPTIIGTPTPAVTSSSYKPYQRLGWILISLGVMIFGILCVVLIINYYRQRDMGKQK